MNSSDAIVLLLKKGFGVDMRAELSIYPSNGAFVVDYVGDRFEELEEVFDSPEEATEYYLELRKKYLDSSMLVL